MIRSGLFVSAAIAAAVFGGTGCREKTDCDVLADMVCAEATAEDCAGARKMAKNANEKEVKACGTFMKFVLDGRKANQQKAEPAKKDEKPAEKAIQAAPVDAGKAVGAAPVQNQGSPAPVPQGNVAGTQQGAAAPVQGTVNPAPAPASGK